MRNILFCLFLLVFLPVTASFATTPPPGGGMTVVTSITLSYDLDKSSLHVWAEHPSDNLEKNYVRMMKVSLNGQVVSTFNYARQSTFAGFSDDVSLKAHVGDVISVELFASGGSSSSEELTVTKSGTPSDPGAATGTDVPAG